MRAIVAAIGLFLFLLLAPAADALRIDFAELPRLAPGDIRVFTLDTEAGTVTFGDGARGAVPPLGRGRILATYDIGAGAVGNVVLIGDDPSPNNPFLIPLDKFPISDTDETEISFLLSGIEAMEFGISDRSFIVTDVQGIPWPPTITLLALVTLALAARAWRRGHG